MERFKLVLAVDMLIAWVRGMATRKRSLQLSWNVYSGRQCKSLRKSSRFRIRKCYAMLCKKIMGIS